MGKHNILNPSIKDSFDKFDGHEVAIKIYDKKSLYETNRRKNVKREIQIMDKMSHECVVTMFEAYESKNKVFVVMEYMSGGTMRSFLKSLQSGNKQAGHI